MLVLARVLLLRFWFLLLLRLLLRLGFRRVPTTTAAAAVAASGTFRQPARHLSTTKRSATCPALRHYPPSLLSPTPTVPHLVWSSRSAMSSSLSGENPSLHGQRQHHDEAVEVEPSSSHVESVRRSEDGCENDNNNDFQKRPPLLDREVSSSGPTGNYVDNAAGEGEGNTTAATAAASDAVTAAPLYITIGPPCSGKTTWIKQQGQMETGLDKNGGGGSSKNNDNSGGSSSSSSSNGKKSTDDGVLDIALDDQRSVYVPINTHYFLYPDQLRQKSQFSNDSKGNSSNKGSAEDSGGDDDERDREADNLSRARLFGKTLTERILDADQAELRSVLQFAAGILTVKQLKEELVKVNGNNGSTSTTAKNNNNNNSSTSKNTSNTNSNDSNTTTVFRSINMINLNSKIPPSQRRNEERAHVYRNQIVPALVDCLVRLEQDERLQEQEAATAAVAFPQEGEEKNEQPRQKGQEGRQGQPQRGRLGELPPTVDLFVREAIYRPHPKTGRTGLEAAMEVFRSASSDKPVAWGNTNTRPTDYKPALAEAERQCRPVHFVLYRDASVAADIVVNTDKEEEQATAATTMRKSSLAIQEGDCDRSNEDNNQHEEEERVSQQEQQLQKQRLANDRLLAWLYHEQQQKDHDCCSEGGGEETALFAVTASGFEDLLRRNVIRLLQTGKYVPAHVIWDMHHRAKESICQVVRLWKREQERQGQEQEQQQQQQKQTKQDLSQQQDKGQGQPDQEQTAAEQEPSTKKRSYMSKFELDKWLARAVHFKMNENRTVVAIPHNSNSGHNDRRRRCNDADRQQQGRRPASYPRRGSGGGGRGGRGRFQDDYDVGGRRQQRAAGSSYVSQRQWSSDRGVPPPARRGGGRNNGGGRGGHGGWEDRRLDNHQYGGGPPRHFHTPYDQHQHQHQQPLLSRDAHPFYPQRGWEPHPQQQQRPDYYHGEYYGDPGRQPHPQQHPEQQSLWGGDGSRYSEPMYPPSGGGGGGRAGERDWHAGGGAERHADANYDRQHQWQRVPESSISSSSPVDHYYHQHRHQQQRQQHHSPYHQEQQQHHSQQPDEYHHSGSSGRRRHHYDYRDQEYYHDRNL